MLQKQEGENSSTEIKDEKKAWCGDDLYFPRGLLKINGVWRDRLTTLEYLDFNDDLEKLSELIVPYFGESLSIASSITSTALITSTFSILVKLARYYQKNPTQEHKTLTVAKALWPEFSSHDQFCKMGRVFQSYPEVFLRTERGYFSFKLSSKELIQMAIRRRINKALQYKAALKYRQSRRLATREVSIETIRRFAKTPDITAKELSQKFGIPVPTAAAYIAHANRVHGRKSSNLSKKVTLVISGNTEALKAFHDELQQGSSKFPGLKFSLRKA